MALTLKNAKPGTGMQYELPVGPAAPAVLTRIPVALPAHVREKLTAYAARKRVSLSTAAAILIERGLGK